MSKYLDYSGVTHLWEKITDELKTKQDKLTAGDNISLIPHTSGATITASDEKVRISLTGVSQTSGTTFPLIFPDIATSGITDGSKYTARYNPNIKINNQQSSLLFGRDVTASGYYSLAEGSGTTALGNQSHAEGGGTIALGNQSHAEGSRTIALGHDSHVEGAGYIDLVHYLLSWSGNSPYVTSYFDVVSNFNVGDILYWHGAYRTVQWVEENIICLDAPFSSDEQTDQDDVYFVWGIATTNGHVEGQNGITYGQIAHAEGEGTKAGIYGHAEGYHTVASGLNSHAEGGGTIALGHDSHAEGANTVAYGESSHAEGYCIYDEFLPQTFIWEESSNTITVSGTTMPLVEVGDVLKYGSIYRKIESISGFTITLDAPFVSEIIDSAQTKTITAKNIHKLLGVAAGIMSHVEGELTIASGPDSHAEGVRTRARGNQSHAEGYGSTALGNCSHAEGNYTIASSNNSHAEGYYTKALGERSHSEGSYTTTLNWAEHAQGQHNVSHNITDFFGSSGNTIHSIGIGTSSGDTKNAIEVMQNGDVYVKGVGQYDGTNVTTAQHLAQVLLNAPSGTVTSITAGNGLNGGTITSAGTISHDIVTRTDTTSTASPSAGGTVNVVDSVTTNTLGHVTAVNTKTVTLPDDTKVQVNSSSTNGMYPLLAVESSSITSGNKYTAIYDSGLKVNPNKHSLKEGYNTSASGNYSHAEGQNSTASNTAAHAEGFQSKASGEYSHAEGGALINKTEYPGGLAIGQGSHAEGAKTVAYGVLSHTEGMGLSSPFINDASWPTTVNGETRWDVIHTSSQISPQGTSFILAWTHGGETIYRVVTNVENTGSGSNVYLNEMFEKGDYSNETISAVTGSAGDVSHVEGAFATAAGEASHAEGSFTIAGGQASHAEGGLTYARGAYSHAEGHSNSSGGESSHVEGDNSHADGQYSHAEGYTTQTQNEAEHAEGKYNISISGVTQHTVGIGTSSEHRNAHLITTNGRHYIPGIGGYDGTENSLVGKKDLASVINGLTPMIEITWSSLKNLRDNSQLVPGKQYRITDYNCTTTQSNTQSAGHQFDVIVVADDVNKLNENARAIRHSGDTYFANCKLESWELKYCIDNDTNRFAWADSTNGKGVIYYMKDEWDNECPYDFKNIQFKRWAVTAYNAVPSLIVNDENNYYSYFYGAKTLSGDNVLSNATYGSNSGWFYTFALKDLASDDWYDYTVVNALGLKDDEGNEVVCYENKLSEAHDEYNSGSGNLSIALNNIVLFNCYENLSDTSYADDYSYCNSNTFGDICYSNTFGNGCRSNTFGNDCYYNTFGNGCYYNTFGNGCYYNTFGNYCYSNLFWNRCYSNLFGDICYSNLFGDSCCFNTFGNDCYSNLFGNRCQFIKFVNSASTSTKRNYYRYIIVENGNQYIYLDCTSTTSSSQYYQNVKIAQGVNNTTSYKTITDANVGQTYQTVYQPANTQVISV